MTKNHQKSDFWEIWWRHNCCKNFENVPLA